MSSMWIFRHVYMKYSTKFDSTAVSYATFIDPHPTFRMSLLFQPLVLIVFGFLSSFWRPKDVCFLVGSLLLCWHVLVLSSLWNLSIVERMVILRILHETIDSRSITSRTFRWIELSFGLISPYWNLFLDLLEIDWGLNLWLFVDWIYLQISSFAWWKGFVFMTFDLIQEYVLVFPDTRMWPGLDSCIPLTVSGISIVTRYFQSTSFLLVSLDD